MFRLYNAAFARLRDAGGLKYSTGEFTSDRNTDLGIAQSFVNSNEFAERYGINVTNTKYIQTLYANVLGRTADAGGLNYWSGLLNACLLYTSPSPRD